MKNTIETPLDIKVLNHVSTCLFILFGCLVITGMIAWYILISSANLKKIIINGDLTHHSALSIRVNIIPSIKGNFFTINLSDTKSVFERLPWISSASVKRVFPNQIEVHLKEHEPMATWGARDDLKMINTEGLIFDVSTDDEEYEKLPQLIGPEGQSGMMLEVYSKLNTILVPLKVKLTRVELSSRGSWTAIIEGGAQLELGRGSIDIIAERIKKFADTVGSVTSNFNKNMTALQYADLRHVNGYALKMNGITTIDHNAINLNTKN